MIANQDGSNAKAIKLPNPTFYFRPDWSPDSKKIAFTDTNFTIWIVDLKTKKLTEIDSDTYAHPNRSMNPKWSPDSNWIAYVKQNKSSFKSVYAYEISSKKII
tara:strand:- start:455 stop:763 length:309 start_codon:yes stop_codon:yes gene_type:complete